MAKCKYIYKGHTFSSELSLEDFLLNNGPELYSKYGDLVFYKTPAATSAIDKANSIAKETKKLQSMYIEAKKKAKLGEDSIEFKPPYVGVTTFLRGLKTESNKLLTPEFNPFEYWRRRIYEWKSGNFNEEERKLFGNGVTFTENVTEAELQNYLNEYEKGNTDTSNTTLQLVKQMTEKWENQGQTGTAIHDVLKSLFTVNLDKKSKYYGKLRLEYDDHTLENLVFKEGGRGYDTSKLTHEHVKQIIKYARGLKESLERTLGDNNLTFFPEFALSAKLGKEVPGKGDTILGILDLLVIDSKGVAHVVDYKATPNDFFNSAKERTFWYQQGIYSRLLSNNGLITESTTPKVMIAPIKMGNYRKEGDAFVMDTIDKRDADYLIDITANATLGTVAENLDEFLPEKSEVNIAPEKVVENVDKFNTEAFPSISTSKTWTDEEITKFIKKNDGYVPNEKGEYSINLGGKNITAKSEGELFDKVKEYFTVTLPKRRKDTVEQVIIALRKGIKEDSSALVLPTTGLINSEEGASSDWLQNLLSKYCHSHYEVVSNPTLEEYGIMAIKNTLNNQLDIIKITTDNLDFQHKFSDATDRQLLTGAFEVDAVQLRKPKSLALKAYNGNIHLMETMAVLNSIPSITSGGYVIGNIQVANPHLLQGMSASNEELIYNFNELAGHIEGYENNLKDIKFANKVQLLANRLEEVLAVGEASSWSTNGKYRSYQGVLTELDDAISAYDKTKVLDQLEKLRKELEKSPGLDITLESYNEDTNTARSLYDKVMLAIAEVQGIQFRQQVKDNDKWLESMNIGENGVQSLMMDNPGQLNNETLNLLTTLVTQAYQNVREDVQREMDDLRSLVENLKQAKGFSKWNEMTNGNQASLYSDLWYEEDGDLFLKNPWDSTVGFRTDAERKLLEHAIEVINRNRFPEVELETIKTSRDKKFFRLPLCKGTTASEVAYLGSMTKGLQAKLKRLNPKTWYAEMQQKIQGIFTDVNKTSDERNLFEMINMFGNEGQDADIRKELIAKLSKDKGMGYFETNLETILLKHTFAYSAQKHIDKVMPLAKAAKIHLAVQGQLTNKQFTNSSNYISDYIKTKVKNEDITDPKIKKTAAVIGEIKSAASFLALGFSPVSYGYQLLQGLWTDLRLMWQSRGLTNEPFTFQNFKFAFSQAYKDFFKLGGKPTKCSLLNEFYGFNDMDMNTYADKIKSDRYGLMNFNNIAFHCASRPDFFNRMAIFITQMKRDGTWDAYSMNSKGQLVYDWKLDKRFDAYANNDKSNLEKYNQQRGLYNAIAEQLEKEHALNKDGSYFKKGDPLPKAYTNEQIEDYKSLSDDIYGYYSHEKKAMIHAVTAGSLWMQMKTFWSGKKNQYLGAPGVKLRGAYVQQKDRDGNLMWMKEDESGQLIPTTENTGVPCIRWEGQWQEGIGVTLYNLKQGVKTVGLKQSIQDMWNNPDEKLRELHRKNIKQIAFDLIWWLGVGSIICGLLRDWDDQLTKDAKTSGELDEALIAAGAHMCIKMVSSSFGDFNFISSIGSPFVSWEPFSLNYFRQRISDAEDVMTGDKKLATAILRSNNLTSNSKVFWDVLLQA